jgi:hypothetical protein
LVESRVLDGLGQAQEIRNVTVGCSDLERSVDGGRRQESEPEATITGKVFLRSKIVNIDLGNVEIKASGSALWGQA